MASYFVDDQTGNDTNDGLDNIGVGLATATWTESTLTLTQNGHGYTFAAGDVIRLLTGTGLTAGTYEVASSTVNTIVLVETTTLIGISNGSAVAAGDDSAGDWTSSDGPWITIDKAMNNVGTGDHVWIRSTGDYTETIAVDTAGGATSAPISFMGYTTTIGDNGKITIDATSQTSAITTVATGNIYYIFENIKFEDATSHGMSMVNADRFICKNCEFNNNGAAGAFVGQGVMFENCIFSGNTGDGCNTQNGTIVVGCQFLSNTLDGLETDNGGFIIDSVFFSNGAIAINFNASAHDWSYVVYGCTFDGDGEDTTTAISLAGGQRSVVAMINNILYDCGTGIGGLNQGRRFSSRNNLVNSNTTDYASGFATFVGEVTGAPVFVTEGSDFNLASSSPAKGTGYDGSVSAGGTSSKDMGALQTVGGGLGGANKRAGKQ